MSRGKAYSYFRFLLFWIFYSVLSLIWVTDFLSWSRVFIFLLSGVITTWFLGLYLTSKTEVLRAFSIVEKLGLLFATFSIYEMITGNYLFLTDENLEFYGSQSSMYSTLGFRVPISIFGNPNHYAVFLIFSTVFSVILSRCKTSKSGRLLSVICYTLSSFLLLSTQSRASFIGLVITLIISFFLIAKRENLMKFVAVLIALLLISVPIVVINFEYIEPLLIVGSEEVNSDLIRENLLRNGVVFLLNSYMFGVGLGNIEYYMNLFPVYYVSDITNIHNWWMEILVSSGVIVFTLYVYNYLKALLFLYKNSKITNNIDDTYISSCFVGLLVGFVIGAVGPSSLFISEWFLPLFGLIMVYINLYKLAE